MCQQATLPRSQSWDGFFITIQFYDIFRNTIFNAVVVYVIYETQKDSKIASTFNVTSLTFANEDNEFS